MVSKEQKEVYTFCKICQQNVPIDIENIDLEKAKGGITTILSVHGDPQHAILIYLDKQRKVRCVEYPSKMQVSSTTELEKGPLPIEDQGYDLKSVISSFGERLDGAIPVFSEILAQIVAGNTIYIVHTNASLAKVVKEQLETLFPNHKNPVFVISYDELDTVTGMRPVIFDLQSGTFISKGVHLEEDYFEKLVRDALHDQSGVGILRNEYNKLKYSYRRLWELLSTGAKKYTKRKLAYLVSIDLCLLPTLLQIAETDGIDIASRVR